MGTRDFPNVAVGFVGFSFRSIEVLISWRSKNHRLLEIFRASDRVTHQCDGDVFIFAYLRKNSSKFAIEELHITNMTFFTYTRIQEKKDSLVILFGKDGVVKNYGSLRGISELTPFKNSPLI
jgi:hypothetical protein